MCKPKCPNLGYFDLKTKTQAAQLRQVLGGFGWIIVTLPFALDIVISINAW
jgi:hypothetical protein